MLELAYLPDGGLQQVDTASLADGVTESVHFKTGTLREGGKGGIVQVANDRRLPGVAEPNGSNIEWSVSKLPNDFPNVHHIAGPNIGAAGFLHFPLDSDSDYYINIKNIGESPNGVQVRMRAGTEAEVRK